MDFRIRPASVHDADAIRAVHHASFGAAYGDLLPEPELSGALEAKGTDWYRKMIDAPGTPRAGTWVAEADGCVVGFAHFRESDESGTADLTLLYLHPDAWGRGVARPLLDGALDDMRTLEFSGVRVEVFADHPRACRFYERAGFRWADDGMCVYGDVAIPVANYRLGL
ncbi:MAG: GNAT family N-acetyltransferase [Planctomycetota bacterium]